MWTAALDAIFPHFGQICSRESRRGGYEAHLEVGTVPQQVPRAPILSIVTLNSRDPELMCLYGILLGLSAGSGALRLLARLSFTLYSMGQV